MARSCRSKVLQNNMISVEDTIACMLHIRYIVLLVLGGSRVACGIADLFLPSLRSQRAEIPRQDSRVFWVVGTVIAPIGTGYVGIRAAPAGQISGCRVCRYLVRLVCLKCLATDANGRFRRICLARRRRKMSGMVVVEAKSLEKSSSGSASGACLRRN